MMQAPPTTRLPVHTPNQQRESYRGLGDGFSRAFELALTPMVFALIGYLADRVLGTAPFAMIGCTVFAIVGMGLRMWFTYDHEMRAHETSFSAVAADRKAAEAARAQAIEAEKAAAAAELAESIARAESTGLHLSTSVIAPSGVSNGRPTTGVASA